MLKRTKSRDTAFAPDALEASLFSPVLDRAAPRPLRPDVPRVRPSKLLRAFCHSTHVGGGNHVGGKGVYRPEKG
jgi:hypothetical protein